MCVIIDKISRWTSHIFTYVKHVRELSFPKRKCPRDKVKQTVTCRFLCQYVFQSFFTFLLLALQVSLRTNLKFFARDCHLLAACLSCHCATNIYPNGKSLFTKFFQLPHILSRLSSRLSCPYLHVIRFPFHTFWNHGHWEPHCAFVSAHSLARILTNRGRGSGDVRNNWSQMLKPLIH